VFSSAPTAGVITAAGQAPGVRYLRCGLCATA
jgi:formate dehydrogenase maturation protein FdhE